MNSKLFSTTLGFSLVATGLLSFSNSASAAVFSSGSEIQLDANLILDGSGDIKFVPKVGTSTTPPTPAEPGDYAVFSIGTGTNLGDFEVYNAPNEPIPPGTFPIQGEILSFQVNPSTLDLITPLPLDDFLILPSATPVGGEIGLVDPIPASTFTITELDISGINQIGTLIDGETPVFSSFGILGSGFFLSEGERTDAILEFTTQGFFSEDLNGDGLIEGSELDTEGSISGSIIVEDEGMQVPEPTSMLSLLFVGSLIGTGVYKNKRHKFN